MRGDSARAPRCRRRVPAADQRQISGSMRWSAAGEPVAMAVLYRPAPAMSWVYAMGEGMTADCPLAWPGIKNRPRGGR